MGELSVKSCQSSSSPQECTHDILAALQINTDIVTKDILSLKDRARKLVCDWLHQHCRGNLSEALVGNSVPCRQERLREAATIGEALMRTDCREPRWHLLYVDTLLAKGEGRQNSAARFLRTILDVNEHAHEIMWWFHRKIPQWSFNPAVVVRRLQVTFRQQGPICARCLARSPEMQRPRPAWGWWRPGSRSTTARLADSAKWPRGIHPVWTSCWAWCLSIRGSARHRWARAPESSFFIKKRMPQVEWFPPDLEEFWLDFTFILFSFHHYQQMNFALCWPSHDRT